MSHSPLQAGRSTTVRLGHRSYEVLTGAALLPRLGTLVAPLVNRGSGRCLLATDSGLPDETVTAARRSLEAAGLRITRARLTATEKDKSLDTVHRLLSELARTRHERFDPLVTLGGGIVGDTAAFAAAIYRRGVPVIQCPTTLLAMVDASVGGKTGVNLSPGPGAPLKKNLVGAFHQPRLVVADVETLGSLPARELRCGLAECIKHGLIAADFGDPDLLDWTERHLSAVLALDPAPLTELVARNVAVKAAVVAGDEREEAEHGGRALLNLGHTFGHAIETIPHLSPDGNPANAPLHHGEAVALGLVAAARCAAALGLCPPELAERVERALAAAGLPTRVAGLPPFDDVLAGMLHDKKVLGGRLRLVLPTAPGRATVVADPDPAAVRAGLDAIRA